MKKLFLVFLSFVFVSICILIPVSASSSEDFDPPYLNANPVYQVFSSADYPQNFRVPYSVYEQYLINYGDLVVFPFCLDSNYSPIDRLSLTGNVKAYRETDDLPMGSIDFTSFVIIDSEYLEDVHARPSYLVFSFNDPSISFISLIPLNSDNDQYIYNAMSLYTESYYRSIPGYSFGYSDGFRVGKVEGFNSVDIESIRNQGYDKGYQEGFDAGEAYGISISDPDEMLPAITDATMKVVSAPFEAITNALNFNVFGVNIASLFFIIITLLVLGFILKHFI